MTAYLLLALGVLVPVAAVSLVVLVRAGRAVLLPALVTVAVLLVATAVFDSVIVGTRIVGYDGVRILGVRIGAAPVEDFAYPIGAGLALPALWHLLGRAAEPTVIAQLLTASRPLSWINTAYPFALTLLLLQRPVDVPLLVIGTAYFLVPYNLAMYGINDVFDYESDLRNPRKGGVEGAVLDPRFHRPILVAAVVTNVPLLAVLVLLGGPAPWLVLAVSAFAVVAYSVRGLRFKERPVLDSITSSTHFVSPAVYAVALAGRVPDTRTLLLLAAFFCWGMASHAFGAVQDIPADREAGIGSVATVVGARAAVAGAAVLYAAAGVLAAVSGPPTALAAIVALPYLAMCAPFLRIDDVHAERANRGWRRFLAINYGAGFLVTLLAIGSVAFA